MTRKVLRLAATLGVGRNRVDVTLSALPGENGTAFVGRIAEPVSFADLARSFGLDLSGVPDALLPTVEDAFVIIDPAGLILLAASTDHADVVLLSDRTAASPRTLASVQTKFSIGLSSLPVIDSLLSPSDDLGLNGLAVLIASEDFAATSIAALNTILSNAGGSAVFPVRQIPKGAMISAELSAGGTIHAIDLAVAAPRPRAARAAAPAASSAAPGASEKWIKLQKSFGPVNVKRVGLAYRQSKLSLMLDAGFMMAGVDLELLGARISFKPTWPPSDIAPGIDGIGVAMQSGAITIGGGLVAIDRPDAEEYDGQLTLSAGAYLLTALASYTKVDGSASMFAFVVLDAPLGGPPFFFVTGVAAGLGVNRDLIIPGLDGVASFPLVAAINGASPFSSNTDPASALGTMAGAIPPRYGANWLALGLRFTTFELLQSAALVTVRFGADVEVDLLGLSTLSVPTGDPDPIGFAQLALEASFRPSDGVLAIGGQLTPASHVLSHDCHLVGGFAMRAWFEDAGEARAGDFVVTLGGYHPAFQVPSWYPTAAPIGAIWQVNENLLIKGGFYFALTPSAVMAGGFIDCTWQSGDLKAWYSAYADFLLSWKPFHYQIDIGIHLGASFRVDLWLTSFTMTIHVGVDLSLWGPSFAGQARVDVSAISFTIHFGASSPGLEPIAWSEFKSSFLPKPASAPATLHAAALDRSSVSVCATRVSGGLIKDLSNTTIAGPRPDWVINSECFELTTFSSIPCKNATVTVGSDSVALTGTWNTGFGVGPVGIAEGDFQSTHAIEIHRVDIATGSVTGTEITLNEFRITGTAALKNVPKAAWLQDVALNPQASLQQAVPLVENALTGITLAAATEDLDVTPLAMDLARLQFDPEPPQRYFPYHTQPQVPGSDPFQGKDPMGTFMTALADPGVARKRDAIVSLLARQNVLASGDTSIDVSAMARSADMVLLSAPTLAYLGEETNRAA